MESIIKNILNAKKNMSKTKLINKIYTFMKQNYKSNFTNYSQKITKQKDNDGISALKECVLKLIRKYSSNIENINNINKNIEEKYCIIKVNTHETKILFLCYTMFYYLDCKYSKNKNMIGIDFEFNNKKIALCQIYLYMIHIILIQMRQIY
jgi:hypothetical protein